MIQGSYMSVNWPENLDGVKPANMPTTMPSLDFSMTCFSSKFWPSWSQSTICCSCSLKNGHTVKIVY